MTLVSIICCDCRWSCRHGDPSGGTCRAKEQARRSDAATLKATKNLRAEQAAHRQSKDKLAKMAVELKHVVGRYDLLEKESQAKAADLKKALDAAKGTRSEFRAAREEL